MKRLIALTGLPRSGKDTVAEELYWHGYTRMSFAEPLKEAAVHLLNCSPNMPWGKHGYDREQIMPEWGFSMRHFLQWLGTEGMRSFQKDFWIRNMEMRLRGYEQVVITDCRFPNEIKLVRDLGGVVIRIERPGLKPSKHVSDKQMPCDIVVRNDGSIADLQEKITCLVATTLFTSKRTKKRPSKSKSVKRATKRVTSSKKRAKSTRATG